MPPRGGQPEGGAGLGGSQCFNTCPHAGGNVGLKRMYESYKEFQYMPPRGGQPPLHLQRLRLSHVSIHAPTRGATPSTPQNLTSTMFQYMPPRGGQHKTSTTTSKATRFNTCPHAGGNTGGSASSQKHYAFQYMPPRGGQQNGWRLWHAERVFQYMPPRGGQQEDSRDAGRQARVSIHAPTRGATCARRWKKCYRRFQYMPPRGGQPS